MSREELKFSVCNSSARTFAMLMTWMDAALSLALALAAGCSVYARGGEMSFSHRVVLTVLAAVGVHSAFVIIRALVPFATRLSFAHMMRLRLPFYVWTVSLIAAAWMCGASRSYAALGPASVQLTLILASVMLTVRFFQSGSLLRLGLAYSCAGGAFGISLLGALAPAVMLLLLWAVAVRIPTASYSTWWADAPHPGVAEYFTNPLVRSRVKWMFVGGFLICFGLAFCLALRGAGGLVGAGRAWLGGIGLDGAVFLFVTAILPLAVGLGKAGPSSDVTEHSAFGNLIVYIAIALLTALFMLKPFLISTLAGLDLHIESNVLALASVFYVFNLLLAGVILLADIRCRDFRGEAGVCVSSLRNVMRFSYAVLTLAPLALPGLAAFLRMR